MMTNARAWLGGLVALTVIVLACGGGEGTGPQDPPKGLAGCQGTAFLTVALIDPALLREIVPLGNLSPPAHTLPTDHLYLNTTLVAAGVSVVADLVAPGNIVITEVSKQTRSGGGPNDGVNYGITFFPCADVFMYFDHIVTLSADLASKVGAITACDAPYTSGGITSFECRKAVEISLAAGTLIGTVGGPTFPGVDYGGNDRRVPPLAFVNPARSHEGGVFGQRNTICPLDYYVPSLASALRAKLSRGGVTRTIPPVCGTFMQDVANTAQGRWYFDNSVPEDAHLALAHDNGDPRVGVISSGTSVPGLTVGARGFTPAVSGRINLDFPLVTSDGLVYCYQSFTPLPPNLRHILIQLVSPTRVRIEGVSGATCGDPSTWAFTSGAREFTR